jgi:hypothetical protein
MFGRPVGLAVSFFVAVLLLSDLCTTSLALTSEEKTALLHMIAAWPVLAPANGGDWDPADIDNACSGTAWTGLLCNLNDHVEVLYVIQHLWPLRRLTLYQNRLSLGATRCTSPKQHLLSRP